MATNEAPASTQSRNHRRGWRPLAVFAGLALATACSGGNTSGSSTEAQNNSGSGNSAVPAPQGPRETRLVADCRQNPQARHTFGDIGDEEGPTRVGNTWIVGILNETAPLTADGKTAAKSGIRIEYKGGHRYLVEPLAGSADPSAPIGPTITTINSADPTALAAYELGGDRFTVGTVPEPRYGLPHRLGIVATVACAGAPRP